MIVLIIALLTILTAPTAALAVDCDAYDFGAAFDRDVDETAGKEMCVGGELYTDTLWATRTLSASGMYFANTGGDPALSCTGPDAYALYPEGTTSNQIKMCENGTLTSIVGANDIDTSAELATLVSDETGSGALVFGTSPTIDATSGSITIPNSTSSNSTTTGRLSFDTNGTTSTVPMTAIGDGTNAVPTRTCWQVTTSIPTSAGNPLYLVGDGVWTGQHVWVPSIMPVTLSGLSCRAGYETANSATYTANVEVGSSCTNSGDGTLQTCTWATGNVTCTSTGTSGTTEVQCTDTTHKDAIATNQVWHIKYNRTGSWTGTQAWCSIMVCADAVW